MRQLTYLCVTTILSCISRMWRFMLLKWANIWRQCGHWCFVTWKWIVANANIQIQPYKSKLLRYKASIMWYPLKHIILSSLRHNIYLEITLLCTAEMCSLSEKGPDKILKQMLHCRLFDFWCTSRMCFVRDSFNTTWENVEKFKNELKWTKMN